MEMNKKNLAMICNNKKHAVFSLVCSYRSVSPGDSGVVLVDVLNCLSSGVRSELVNVLIEVIVSDIDNSTLSNSELVSE